MEGLRCSRANELKRPTINDSAYVGSPKTVDNPMRQKVMTRYGFPLVTHKPHCRFPIARRFQENRANQCLEFRSPQWVVEAIEND